MKLINSVYPLHLVSFDLYFNVQTSIVSLSFTTPSSLQQLLDKFDSNDDGNVDFDEFLMVDTYFPMAFFPVFRMQVWFGFMMRKDTPNPHSNF